MIEVFEELKSTVELMKDNHNYDFDTILYCIDQVEEHLNPEWVKVSDDLPKEDCDCIVWDEYHGCQKMLPFNLVHDCWDQEDGDDYYTDSIGGNVTHWKPTGQRPVKE